MVQFSGRINSKLRGFNDSIFAVMSTLAKEENAINLSQGFPDFNCPAELIELVNKYMKEGRNQYAPMPGYIGLKEKIAEKIEKLYSTKYNPETEIVITAGATQALYTAISSVVKEGDEVILFEPAYDSYLPAILMNKGVPKYVKMEPPEYKIDWELVKRLLNSKTKMIIINTPHNPTGSILNVQDLLKLDKIINDRDIVVLSDEVYEHIIFDNYEHQSICRFPSLVNKSFVVSSFGKVYHTTGWKMGYVLAPEKLLKEFKKVFQFLMFAAPTPLQYAYADFLDNEKHYLELGDFYQKKRDLFMEGIKSSRFEIIPSSGTYFQCLDYSKITEENDRDFAKRLTKESKIASIPVSSFYHKKDDEKILRFCFAKEEKTLEKAIEILCKI
ncbi:MAG: methionine aminotransferase [Bacteroidota bacterium]|nr:methionine aminotransferase [Bacteroidota bacterium]